jgi:hypothetical protein
MVEQCSLRATFVIIIPLVNSMPTVTVKTLAGGEESCTFHPWSTWDVLGEHVEFKARLVAAPILRRPIRGGELWYTGICVCSRPCYVFMCVCEYGMLAMYVIG